MGYMAELDENNTVTRVLAADMSLPWDLPGVWVESQSDTPLRKNPVGIGYIYDGIGFSPPQPYPSWVKNMDTYQWEPPIPYPSEGGSYQWSETSWDNDQIGWVTL